MTSPWETSAPVTREEAFIAAVRDNLTHGGSTPRTDARAELANEKAPAADQSGEGGATQKGNRS